MKVVIFSGTTEGRSFSRALAALGGGDGLRGDRAGGRGAGRRRGITVRTGRLDAEGMTALLQGAALCVDATHPYAAEATRNIRAAAAAAGVEYHRLLRPASPLPAGAVWCWPMPPRPRRIWPERRGMSCWRPVPRSCPPSHARPGTALPPRSADAGGYCRLRGSGYSAPQYHRDAGAVFP